MMQYLGDYPGFVCSAAAAKYKIPYTDLVERMLCRKTREALANKVLLKQPIGERELSDEDEIEIMETLRYMGEVCNMPVDKDTVKDKVNGFLKSKGRTIQSETFKNNIPDDYWVSIL